MNNKDENVMEVYGEVDENLPNTMFRVTLDQEYGGKELICYLSGRMRKNYIKILPGDRVKIEVSKYDLNKGRIVYRMKNEGRSPQGSKSTSGSS